MKQFLVWPIDEYGPVGGWRRVDALSARDALLSFVRTDIDSPTGDDNEDIARYAARCASGFAGQHVAPSSIRDGRDGGHAAIAIGYGSVLTRVVVRGEQEEQDDQLSLVIFGERKLEPEARELLEWIHGTLFQKVGDGTYYYPYDADSGRSLLGSETVFYSTLLESDFVETMVNGGAAPAAFRYSMLVKALREATEWEACHAFYVMDPDNALSILEYTAPLPAVSAVYESSSFLDLFEERKAVQGGVSYLLLVGTTRKWVLHHELSPGSEFTISFHGPPVLAERIMSKLSMSPAKDMRRDHAGTSG